jgi:hypothetical protein
MPLPTERATGNLPPSSGLGSVARSDPHLLPNGEHGHREGEEATPAIARFLSLSQVIDSEIRAMVCSLL